MHWQFNMEYLEARCQFEAVHGYHTFRGDLYGMYCMGGNL